MGLTFSKLPTGAVLKYGDKRVRRLRAAVSKRHFAPKYAILRPPP